MTLRLSILAALFLAGTATLVGSPANAELAAASYAPTAPATTAVWWDPSYFVRRTMIVSAGAVAIPAGSLAVVSLDHQELVAIGQAQADGDDVRLVHQNGVVLTELARVAASGSGWGLPSTTLAFKTLAPIPATVSDSNYFLYHGNLAAASPPTEVPEARLSGIEVLPEQSTSSETFVDVPGATLTFSPGSSAETWLVLSSGVMRSSSTSDLVAEMRLLHNGVEVDLWGHQNNSAATPNGAGFLRFLRITGTADPQMIQIQYRAGQSGGATTTAARSIRILAALMPPGADLQVSENLAIDHLAGANLSLLNLTFSPSDAGDYFILGQLSQREFPGQSTAQAWLEASDGTLHPDAPAGTRFSNDRQPWQPFSTGFRKTLVTGPKTFTLRGTSSTSGSTESQWRSRRLLAFRTDAWESAEYAEALGQSTTTSASFQPKVTLTTASPPGPRDYLLIEMARISGVSSSGASKSGELREGATALVRTDHRIERDGSANAGYHHIVGVAVGRRTNAPVTYMAGFLSPGGIIVQCAEATILALRYPEPVVQLGSPAVLDAASPGVPSRDSLAPPSPNPSRGTVALRFHLSRAARARLGVYDVSGRRVRKLRYGILAEGAHTEWFDLRDDRGRILQSGVYIVRLECGGEARIQRLIVTK